MCVFYVSQEMSQLSTLRDASLALTVSQLRSFVKTQTHKITLSL